ncbi:MAG: hypothetical protein ACR2KX_12675 [Chitinophagaceae bacterium]
MDIFSIQNLSLFFATLLCGLLTGLFYDYSCSVNNGLGRLNDPGYLKAMRSINKVILNPVFFLRFFSYTPYPSIEFYLLLSATIIYFTGVFGVTVMKCVPIIKQTAILILHKKDYAPTY